MDSQKSNPKYFSVYTQLKSEILSSDRDRGSRLPTEKALMERFGASRTTIRRAIALLRDEELIESRRGHGTDVITSRWEPNSTQGRRLSEVVGVDFEFMRPCKETSNSEPLVDIVPSDDEIASALQIPPGTKVYRIRWLHYMDETPYLYLLNFVRIDFAPDLPKYTNGMISLYPLLSKHFDLNFTHATETVTPGIADLIVAKLLDVPENSPITHLKRIAYCSKGPMDYGRSYIRPDLLQLKLFIENIRTHDKTFKNY